MTPRQALTDTGREDDVELDELRARILRAIGPLLRVAGVDSHEVTCAVDGGIDRIHVVLAGPAEVDGVRQALGVRVMDAVRGAGRTLGAVAVEYRFGR